MSNFTLRKSRDFGDVIGDSFTYFRYHFSSLGKGLVLFSLPVIILSGILIGSAMGEVISITETGTEPGPEELIGFGFNFFGGLVLLMVTLVVIIQIVFMHIRLVDEGHSNQSISVGMLLQDFPRNFFGLIGLFIVISLASMIGALFFIIPGIYVATKLSLAPAIFIIEEEDFGDALSKSWSITQDYWWFTFGVSFVMSLITNIVSNVVIVPFYIIIMLVTFGTGEPDLELFSMLFSIMYALMMVFVGLLYCFPITSQALVYFHLDETKTGRSLSERIDSLGGN
ncbi:MAG: hypothetical protein MI700_08655 [Balneolales bacterium]|nr:hypothetical protein [Balneolales bacterium]